MSNLGNVLSYEGMSEMHILMLVNALASVAAFC